MYPSRFHSLSSSISRVRNRRVATRLLGGLLAVPLTGVLSAEAKKKKKATFCLNGETIKASRKKKKQLLKKGATPGACTARTCAANAECGSGAICASGTCQTCSVTCNGDSAACGAALQQRLDQGGTVYVCPGRYAGNFAAGVVTVVGAGQGEEPATSTILDARNSGRVLSLRDGVTASLSRLRITGGSLGDGTGGGIYASGADLRIEGCAIEMNTAPGCAGLDIRGGRFQLIDSSLSKNRASVSAGAGICLSTFVTAAIIDSRITGNKSDGPSGAVVGSGVNIYQAELTITRSEISGNTATDGGAGIGIYPVATVTLDSATRIVNNISGSSMGGGGVYQFNMSTFNQNGATIDNNTPNNFKHQ